MVECCLDTGHMRDLTHYIVHFQYHGTIGEYIAFLIAKVNVYNNYNNIISFANITTFQILAYAYLLTMAC